MEAGGFLLAISSAPVEPVYVLVGQDDFLRRQVGKAIRERVLAPPDQPFGLFHGDTASYAQVYEELATLSMFGGVRLAWVEQADTFVSKNRDSLEKLLQNPCKNGVLLLEVASWPSNTKLAKALSKNALVHCDAPTGQDALAKWCARHAEKVHQKPLAPDAAVLLASLVGPDLGRMDQEVAKLACYAAKNKRIEAADVDRLVGLGQVEKVWKLMDFLGQGDSRALFQLLSELLESGEDPLKVLGACGYQLRKLAIAGRLLLQDKPMAFALEKAGVVPFARNQAQVQLQKLGRAKVKKLLSWIVETDAGMKGASPLPSKILLERLMTRLAAK
ncbi:MAG: DNA polymerase III subunit delta [Gemmataceae bacterium]|nr:DNA polymerase III subunit delta [Gemmataceae bacterium]